MAKTRVFVSHSSKGADAAKRLDDVHSGLQGRGYDVLMDICDIRSGEEWRQKIHRMLAQCHAAVILFNQDAIDSRWVLKEATILAWRHALERPAFKLLPVRLGDVAS